MFFFFYDNLKFRKKNYYLSEFSHSGPRNSENEEGTRRSFNKSLTLRVSRKFGYKSGYDRISGV